MPPNIDSIACAAGSVAQSSKRHWRDPSRLADVETALATLGVAIDARGIRSVAIPALGCGLGGLAWRDVRPRMEAALAPLAGVRVLLFGPHAPPA